MKNNETFLVQVDVHNRWSEGKYREVTADELDAILDKFGARVLHIVSNGQEGAMAMWACFKNSINGGCYSDMINAYRLLSSDTKSLVDREHELRHAWNEYYELWQIRYFGSVHAYYEAKAKKAKERYECYALKAVK